MANVGSAEGVDDPRSEVESAHGVGGSIGPPSALLMGSGRRGSSSTEGSPRSIARGCARRCPGDRTRRQASSSRASASTRASRRRQTVRRPRPTPCGTPPIARPSRGWATSVDSHPLCGPTSSPLASDPTAGPLPAYKSCCPERPRKGAVRNEGDPLCRSDSAISWLRAWPCSSRP